MTNVPDELREVWKEIYILFDTHYKMPNTEEAWTEYWREAEKIVNKHSNMHLTELVLAVSEMIADRMKEEYSNV